MRNLNNIVRLPKTNPGKRDFLGEIDQAKKNRAAYWSFSQHVDLEIEQFFDFADELKLQKGNKKIARKLNAELCKALEAVQAVYNTLSRHESELERAFENAWLFAPIAPRQPKLIGRHDAMVDVSINDDPEYKDTYNPLAPRYWQRHKEDELTIAMLGDVEKELEDLLK